MLPSLVEWLFPKFNVLSVFIILPDNLCQFKSMELSEHLKWNPRCTKMTSIATFTTRFLNADGNCFTNAFHKRSKTNQCPNHLTSSRCFRINSVKIAKIVKRALIFLSKQQFSHHMIFLKAVLKPFNF